MPFGRTLRSRESVTPASSNLTMFAAAALGRNKFANTKAVLKRARRVSFCG